MVELLILGSSAGIPTAKRHSSSMAIKKNGRLYLIDCGGPVCSLLKKMGEDPLDIEAVFLTHWHPDHASGLPMLIQDLQLSKRKKSLTVYGPAGTENKVRLLQTIFLIPPDIYPFELNVEEYREDAAFDNGELQVRFFKTRHLSQEIWKELDRKYGNEIIPVAYGMDVRFNGQKMIVSGDLLNSDDLLPVLPEASMVVHEFGHIKPDGLNRFVREHGIRKLLVTHIHHEWDDREEELASLVSAGHSGEVYIAHDLMRFPL